MKLSQVLTAPEVHSANLPHTSSTNSRLWLTH